MSRIYTVSYNGTVANAGGDADLVEILPGDDKPVRLLGMMLSQTSEVGDTAEEGLRISILRLPATVTSGSGGSSVTPQFLDGTDNIAAGFTAECNNSTVATTSGSAITLYELGWNIRMSPYDFWFPEPRFAPVVRQTEGLVVRMQTTPADDFTGQFTFICEEF